MVQSKSSITALSVLIFDPYQILKWQIRSANSEHDCILALEQIPVQPQRRVRDGPITLI